MKFENVVIGHFDAAIRGMRNAKGDKSRAKADSKISVFRLSPLSFEAEKNYLNVLQVLYPDVIHFEMGPNDLTLAKTLIAAGPSHRKFMRMITVTVDITAPRYWWIEFDTYKIGTVANSESTMHTIHEKLLTKDDFSEISDDMLDIVNKYIVEYQKNRNKKNLRKLKAHLPEGFLQKRTVLLNYENIITMFDQRKNHPLSEWNTDFVNWVLSLPYMTDFLKEAGYYEDKKTER